MNYSIPATLVAERDADNQFSEMMHARKTDFTIPASDVSIPTAGGRVSFSLSDSQTMYSFRDTAVVFNAAIADTNTSGTIDFDFSKMIDSIIVKNGSKTLVDIKDAWVIEQIMQRFRGTEEEDNSATDGSAYYKGNASLYRYSYVYSAAPSILHVEIPLARFADFFLNEHYINFGTTTIEITFSATAKAISGSGAGGSTAITLSDIRLPVVIQRLDSTVFNAFMAQITNENPMVQNMKHYTISSFGIASNRAVIQDAPQVRSLDRLHGMCSLGDVREPVPIEVLNQFNIRINGNALKESGINNTAELGHMTLESGNMISNEITGMNDEWMTNWQQTDGVPHITVFSLQTAFEPDQKNVMGGLSTMNRQKLTGDYYGTAGSANLLWIVSEYTYSLVTYPDRVERQD